VPLDRQAAQVNSDVEAIRVGATGWGRPEDIEIETRGAAQSMYVTSTSERLVLRVELRGAAAVVSNYVQEEVKSRGSRVSPTAPPRSRGSTSTHRAPRSTSTCSTRAGRWATT
jgi:secreted PhoX family phosphatase